MAIKYLTPRSTEELEKFERNLLSGKTVKELSYDELMDLRIIIYNESQQRIANLKQEKKMQFKKGQKVSFMGRDGIHFGIITRRNKQRANILENITGNPLVTSRRWRVPYEHLTLVRV